MQIKTLNQIIVRIPIIINLKISKKTIVMLINPNKIIIPVRTKTRKIRKINQKEK
jgi:hypothetical protein